jgi:hypothetical protein
MASSSPGDSVAPLSALSQDSDTSFTMPKEGIPLASQSLFASVVLLCRFSTVSASSAGISILAAVLEPSVGAKLASISQILSNSSERNVFSLKLIFSTVK